MRSAGAASDWVFSDMTVEDLPDVDVVVAGSGGGGMHAQVMFEG